LKNDDERRNTDASGKCESDRRRFHVCTEARDGPQAHDTMVSIEGEPMRAVTWVVVEEVKSGDWGIAGNPLTTNDVKALAAGKPKE
jgi:hypothetical protein